MSVISTLGSAAAALPALNPHSHGHKKGSHVQSADDAGGSSDGAAKVPAGLQQNLFGSLLNSLEQAIGVQATTPAGAAAGTASAAAGTASAAAGTRSQASTANPVSAAAQSSLTLLQNYLNNLLHNARTDASPAAKLAGSNLNVTV